jgi:hypothetical protein
MAARALRSASLAPLRAAIMAFNAASHSDRSQRVEFGPTRIGFG